MRLAIVTIFCCTCALGTVAERHGSGSAGERVIPSRVLKLEDGLLHVTLADNQHEVIVPTTDKTEIRIDGERAKLTDLTPGMVAEITQVDGVTTTIECKRGVHRK